MTTTIRIAIGLIILGGIGSGAYFPAASYWKQRNKPQWRLADVETGRITSVVNSTGTVKPVLSVHVGALVSGPVYDLRADFNDQVKEGDILAVIDPVRFEAAVARDEAALNSRLAECKRVDAMLNQSIADQDRAKKLHEMNPKYISQAELDQLRYNRASLDAQLELAHASVKQAEANLMDSTTNLSYTKVVSPVDGIVIDRKIDEGQALAATFQTPELFIVAPNLEKEMHIFASVDETDIGLIRGAQKAGQPVHFTVDAYPDDLFEGSIHEIRLSSTELQNVVTYPVVVSTPNPELKLLPGMTANISFHVEERNDAIKVPNSALRFYPQEKHVRKEDRKLLKGEAWEEEQEDQEIDLSADEKAELRRKRNRRHVWVVEGELLKAIEVVTGLSDSKFSELVEGDLKDGQKLVVGLQTK